MGKGKKRRLEAETPKVYKTGLGTEGVKSHLSNTATPIGLFDIKVTKLELKKRKERESRFSETYSNTSKLAEATIPGPLYRSLTASRTGQTEQTRADGGEFIGLNLELEKPYLRLTDYPKVEDVRPFEVLVKSLAHIKAKYIQDEDFEWANEQLKSIRQDMTVQPSIRNGFVLDVYETHARLLLENGDLDEFNKCQTMISSLTGCNQTNSVDDSFGGTFEGKRNLSKNNHQTVEPLKQSLEAVDEFTGYAILYGVIRESHLELKSLLAKAKAAVQQEGAISNSSSHAIQVLSAVNACDYRTFFKLYPCSPNLSAYLMDFLVQRLRNQAIKRIIAAYRPTVSVEQLREWLCFHDFEETRAFLNQSNAVFVEEKGSPPFYVDCKATQMNLK